MTVGAPVAPARHDSVPQPRTPEDVEAQLRQAATDGTATDGATDSTADSTADGAATDSAADDTATDGTATGSAATAERLRAAFTERLRSAAAPPEGNRPAPAARSAREELRGLGSRRPSPSRRLRRMHPQTDRTGQEATARETAATDPTGAPGAPTRGAGPAGAPTGATGASTDRAPLAGGRTATEAGPAGAPGRGSAAGSGPWAEEFGVEPPLGILIGGSPVQSEAVGRPEERAPVRVAAEPIRVGRGTSLVVLPSWRPAIAVSVSTEQLLAETGLSIDQLAVTRLTVWMNPWALHDRELDLHGWEPGPSGQAGPAGRARRGGPGGPGGRGQGPSGRDPISPEASRNR
ncbi:hypothetical protein AB0O91_27250 [Kitasatospora sp. NPDC089797]|uniref:hypothetical protein n=1 Tax=Kitasatospora sp. NPDC089797 TaxID=3155298 RepID=UPI0034381778